MKIQRLFALFFSPTGSTRRVSLTLAREIGELAGLVPETADLSFPSLRRQARSFQPGDLLILGVPVYAGRVPNLIAPELRENLSGNGALALPFVTFGNRAFDDAPGELAALLTDAGFRVIAAAAVVSRHAFSDALAPGRPDEADRAALRSFTAGVFEKISAGACPDPVSVPCPGGLQSYYQPLTQDGRPARFLKAKPKTDASRCEGCCFCAGICPTGAISREDPTQTPGLCIKCQACVRRCPARARYFDDPDYLSHVAMLEENHSRRAESEFWL